MSQMETCWLGCITSLHIGCRNPEVFIWLGWICGWLRNHGRSCVELAALCSCPWLIWSLLSSSSRLDIDIDILLWEISAIASSGYLFYLSKKKKYLKNTSCWLLAMLLCESIVRICLVVFNDKLDSMILGIWEYSTDPWTEIQSTVILSSAIFIDPVNIKQINATKIHDVSNVSDGNLLVGMRYVPAYWL